MGDIQILVPVAPSRIDERPLAPRSTTLCGLRLGVLDNGKANAGLLLDTVTEALADKVPDLRFEREHKGASEGAPTAVMGRLQRCDAVLLAIADWGSCTSWCIHDAVTLELAGIPTAVLCSDEFGPLGRAESQVLGLGGLPLIPLPHPLAGNAADLVRAKGLAVADEVLHALTTPADQLADEHRGRFVRLTQRRLAGGAVCTDESCAIDLALG